MPMGLASFIEFEGGTRWNELLAASLVGMLPLILLFLFAQRYFVKGIASSGLKGGLLFSATLRSQPIFRRRSSL
ncbi:hypothetical protein HC891_13920 [Candidatus Gracilibacteria bacterium]|nr:hypothetical protein [Candidatus Gracilibacteria bacterium]